jgi:hypothetical protein
VLLLEGRAANPVERHERTSTSGSGCRRRRYVGATYNGHLHLANESTGEPNAGGVGFRHPYASGIPDVFKRSWNRFLKQSRDSSVAVDSRCYRLGRLWRLDIFAVPTHHASSGGGSSGADWNPGLAIHQSDRGSTYSGQAHGPHRGDDEKALSDCS